MKKSSDLNNNYEVSDDNFYRSFENGLGLTTNHVAYEVLGAVSRHYLNKTFPNQQLRLCDVGCYLGGTSARWHQHYQDEAQVIGVDIHESNIRIARSTYKQIERLSFQFMKRGGAIPLLDKQLYHGIFTTFVLDTIHNFNDVVQLCKNMVSALLPGGEIYLLRLHPKALCYSGSFREYQVNTKQEWEHGDSLHIKLIRDDGQTIEIDDCFWQPAKIQDVFVVSGCDVQIMDISFQSESVLVQHLERQIQQVNLPSIMPEWTVPLYQIMRAKKSYIKY